jgi:hypothetical protein
MRQRGVRTVGPPVDHEPGSLTSTASPPPSRLGPGTPRLVLDERTVRFAVSPTTVRRQPPSPTTQEK